MAPVPAISGSDATGPAANPGDVVSRMRPGVILFVLGAEFVGLVLLLLGYLTSWNGWGPARIPAVLGDVFPLIVPWGGALGAVVAGIVGLSSHWKGLLVNAPEQGEDWNAWYLMRLPVGATLGSVGVLMVVFFLRTVGSVTDNGTSSATAKVVKAAVTGAANAAGTNVVVSTASNLDVSVAGTLVLMVIAFVIGYKQRVFLELLTRVVQVILGPGDTSTQVTGFSTSPDLIEFTGTPVGTPATLPIAITNEGSKSITVPLSSMTFSNDVFAAAGSPGPLGSGASGQLPIRFTPTTPGTVTGVVTVTVNGMTRMIDLKGTSVAA